MRALPRLATALRTVTAAALVVLASGALVRAIGAAFDPFQAYPGHTSDYGVARARAMRAALPDIAAVFGAAHHAMAQGRGAVVAMYSLAGASALYTSSPLERAHRDLHAMAAHIIAQPNYVEDTGRVQLGLKPLNPLYLI